MNIEQGVMIRQIAGHFGLTVPGVVDWGTSEATRRGVPFASVIEEFHKLLTDEERMVPE